MDTFQYKFKDLLLEKGLMKGPFGGDVKKEYFVPKSNNTFKVYEQGVVYNKDCNFGNYYIDEERFNKLQRFEVLPGDILLSGAGTLGELYEVPSSIERGIINQALIRVRINESIVNKTFFKYYFKWYIKVVACKQVGASVIPNLPPLEVLKEIPVKIPSLPDQHRIANVLSTIDKKIQVNKQINEQLEQMAKTLYDYWFVQFDFPDANGKPYKSSGGKMVYNETLKREIPAGWNNGILSNIANITMGQSPVGSSYNVEGNGMIFYQGCTDFGLRFPTERMYTTEPSRLAKKGDVLMSVRAPVGSLNFANKDCCIGRGLASLNSKFNSQTHLYYELVQFRETFNQRNSVGTTFGSINKEDLYSLPVVVPNSEIIAQFEILCKPMFEKQMILGEENQKLTALRDKLLPLLMNGQVTVKE